MLKKKMMKRKILFVLCLILGSMICLPAQAIIIDNVVVTPSNIVMPTLAGDTFSFDVIIDDSMGLTATGFASTFSVSGAAGLSFDAAASKTVVTDSDYWIVGNTDASALDKGSNTYEFGDGPEDPAVEVLVDGDIMARYSFIWDGTAGDYTFTLDFDTTKSFIQDESYNTQPLDFTPGQYPGDGDAGIFTVTIPEPATLILMCLGTAVLRRKRRVP